MWLLLHTYCVHARAWLVLHKEIHRLILSRPHFLLPSRLCALPAVRAQDYIDELLVNLEHNIASNSTPEIKLKSVGCRNGAPMHAIMADHGKAADRQQDQRYVLEDLPDDPNT